MGKPELKVTTSPDDRSKRAYTDPKISTRGGFGGILESVLRRFKTLTHVLVIIPLYGIGCITLGLAAAPALALHEFLSANIATTWPAVFRYSAHGTAIAACYYTYGFSLLFVVPAINFVLRANLKPWRGPYYSLEAIRWYIHSGATYLARYTFLEFATPTPFNIMFYRLMRMKIGRGVAINSTCISDPSMIELGDKVTIGGSVTLVAHYGQAGFLVLAPTKIGNGVTIGLRATIMGGVTIGDGAKILPNSVVLPMTGIS